MESLYPFLVLVHVFSAIVWVGGVFFMVLVAVPAAKRLNPALRRKLLDDVGRRFRTIGWTALGLLVVTGLVMMWRWGARVDNVLDLSFFEHGHTRQLGYKLIAVFVMLIVSGVHDFWLGPKATGEDRTAEQREKDRRLASLLGRATGLLVLVIVVLAVYVARPWM